jgi:hypothetical protein
LFDTGFLEVAAKAKENIELGPDLGWIVGALTGTDDFEELELLALFLEDDHDVGSGAGAEGQQQEFHGAGRSVGAAVGVYGDGMTGRAHGDELLFANPPHRRCLYMVRLHEGPPRAIFKHNNRSGDSRVE